jgi:uncharacterized iron-regulated protein
MSPVNRSLPLICPLLAIVVTGCARVPRQPIPELPAEQKARLVRYLETHRQSPEDYIVSKFNDHDIVFVGEYHRIKHDVELIQRLIPKLYEAGVYHLAIEFGNVERQDDADALLTADTYDEDLARQMMFEYFVFWGYQEYMDLYRAAWTLNRSLPDDAPRFRIVHLNYRRYWPARKKKMTPEAWKKVWHKGDGDAHMARVILDELVRPGHKALVYSGVHHAFTRYGQPVCDYETQEFIRHVNDRMGNIVYRQIGDRAFNVFLHSPWERKWKPDEHSYPVAGAIDTMMSRFEDKRVGFDVRGTPFGKLTDDNAYYAIGYQNFTLANFCDGYVFQGDFRDYEGCTVDPKFITWKNLSEARAYCPNPTGRFFLCCPGVWHWSMRRDADMARRFADLQ